MSKQLKKYVFLLGFPWLFLWEVAVLANDSSLISLPEVTIDGQRDETEGTGLFPSGSPPEIVALDRSKSKPISQELASSPSVQLRPMVTGVSPPSFSLRGMDPAQTLIFIEGIPLTEPVFFSDNLSLVPKLAMEEAEVFAEAVPAALLSSSLGGAINLRLKKKTPGPTLLAQGGNLGAMRLGGQSQITPGLYLNIEFEKSNENFSYVNNNGTPFNKADDQLVERTHNRFQRVTLLPFFQLRQSHRKKIEAFSITSFQAAEVPGPTFRPKPHQLKEWNSLNAIHGTTQISENLSAEASFFFRIRNDFLRDQPHEESRSVIQEDHSLNLTGGSKAILHWKNGPWNNLFALGVSYSKYQVDGQLQKTRKLGIERTEVPASWVTSFRLVPSVELKPAFLLSFSDRNLRASPQLGFEARPKSYLRVFGSSGWVFRRPSLSELYGNGYSISANEELATERALKGEIGFEWSPAIFSAQRRSLLSWVLFGARAQDLISFSQVGPGLQRAENIGRASWIGQELVFRHNNSWGGYFRPSLLWLWTQNESEVKAESGKNLPFRFPLSLQIGVGVSRNQWDFGYRASFFSASFLDRVNLERLEPYQLHDLFLSLKVKEWGSFELNIQNLFNLTIAKVLMAGVESSQSISGVNGYPAAGRRVGVLWVYDL